MRYNVVETIKGSDALAWRLFTGDGRSSLIEALLVLLVDEPVRHAAPSDCHHGTNTQHHAGLVEGRVEDELEARRWRSKTIKASLGGIWNFGGAKTIQPVLTCSSSWSMGRFAFISGQWFFALCIFAVDSCRPATRREAAADADLARANVMVEGW
jgi:hypothetical protein